MTETITLKARPTDYKKCFPNACFSPPDGLRSSEPGDIVQAVSMMDGMCFASKAVWGLVPPAHSTHCITYADGATVSRMHTTSSAFRNWRCLVPASLFTYVREVDGVTMRYKLSRRDGEVMLLAGIMEPNPPRFGGQEATVALIRTPSNRLLGPHGLYAPLVLEQKQVEPWLRPGTSVTEVKGFIQPPADHALKLTINLEPVAEPALT